MSKRISIRRNALMPMPDRTRRKLAVGLLAALAGARSRAQIYRGEDEHGAVLLSNFPSDVTPELIVESPVDAAAPEVRADTLETGPVARGAVRPSQAPLAVDMTERAQAFRPIIEKVAREQSVSPQLLHAVIRVESGYQDKVVSPKGAVGLMQLMPDTARRFGVRDAYDARQNVEGGARYLKWLLDFFKGDLRLVLAAYNAGENAVIKAGYRIPQIAETIEYVPKVLWHLRHMAAAQNR